MNSNSPLFKLNLKDIGNSLGVSVLGGVAGNVANTLANSGSLSNITFQGCVMPALTTGITYLLYTLLSGLNGKPFTNN